MRQATRDLAVNLSEDSRCSVTPLYKAELTDVSTSVKRIADF
jgi:hypothetical protein